MSTPSFCNVPGNSDIAGIGVRVAVYIQAALVVINTFLAEKDIFKPQPSDSAQETSTNNRGTYYNSAAFNATVDQVLGKFSEIMNSDVSKAADRALERSLFVTGWALVVSALIEAFSKNNSASGLSDYHTLVVLNLSFVNCWAGFNLLMRRGGRKLAKIYNPFTSKREESGPWIAFYIHATIFSVLGILFWIDRAPFLRYTRNEGLNFDSSQDCQSGVIYWAFWPIPLTSRPLKIISLTFYFLSVVPVLSGFVTQAISLFAAGVLMCVTMIATIPLILIYILIAFPIVCAISFCSFASGSVDTPDHAGRTFMTSALADLVRLLYQFRVIHWHATTLIYTGPIIYWIVTTEMLVRYNAACVGEDVEKEWTYGQVMALLTACMMIGFYAFQIVENNQREELKKRRTEEEEKQKKDEEKRKEQAAGALEETCHQGDQRDSGIAMPEPTLCVSPNATQTDKLATNV